MIPTLRGVRRSHPKRQDSWAPRIQGRKNRVCCGHRPKIAVGSFRGWDETEEQDLEIHTSVAHLEIFSEVSEHHYL